MTSAWVGLDDPDAYRRAAVCEYFVKCDRPADGIVLHAAAGIVPTCQRCADLASADLVRWSSVRTRT